MQREATTLNGTTVTAFIGAVVIGGANFIAVKFSNEDLAPLFGATVRFGLAAALLFGIAAVLRIPMPRGSGAIGVSLYGLLGFGFAYGLLYYALVGLGAGSTSVVTAAVPLVTLVLAVLHGQERLSLRGIIGGLLAIAGILMLSLGSLGGDLAPKYLVAALLGVVAIAESSVVIKAFPKAHPVTTNALAMAVGTIFLAAASVAFNEEWTLPEMARTWFVLLWLVVAGSVGLFALFLFVIRRWTASATVYALTLMPVVAVTLGTLLGDEPVTIELVIGALLVMSAVYIGAASQASGSEPPATVPEAAGATMDTMAEDRP